MRLSGSRGWDARRVPVLLLTVLYSSVALALASTDGVLDAERYGAPIHVEADGNLDCAPHHDHAICQVARSVTLGNPSRDPGQVVMGQPDGPLHGVPAAEASTPANDRLRGSPGPRAPPAA